MKSIVIYGPGDMKRLVRGEGAEVNALAAVNEGGVARRLHGSPLGDLAMLGDGRLPATVEAFDLAYPGFEDWYA
ncbi:hypothetical protein [uncultured Caulobacter sp.]|jgi:hypothetical protein|uniref:hypothetical protein n=1 Tax=uncultured Caulobacter sp. TaxID=158749 RepID=UPI0026361230|nr:hypothetical protein [uncultured Caulobacter sp.]